MKKRSVLKEESLQRILQSSGRQIRENGLSGTAISSVMQDAGLTHGTFYSHFKDKGEMLRAALEHALVENRPRWIDSREGEAWSERLVRLAKRYLTKAHRDDLGNSCALAALVSEAARSNKDFRYGYEQELYKSIESICEDSPCDAALSPEKNDETVLFLALCIGGINLSRAVSSRELSDEILRICSMGVERIVSDKNSQAALSLHESEHENENEREMTLEDFPVCTYEKLRYSDTDRQGNVNNSVFSTMLETGRVEVLYNAERPLASYNCSFVTVTQQLDFHAEVNWPGDVDIGTRVEKIGRSSITFEQAVFQHEQLKAIGSTIIVQMNNTTQRSEPLRGVAVENLRKLMIQSS